MRIYLSLAFALMLGMVAVWAADDENYGAARREQSAGSEDWPAVMPVAVTRPRAVPGRAASPRIGGEPGRRMVNQFFSALKGGKKSSKLLGFEELCSPSDAQEFSLDIGANGEGDDSAQGESAGEEEASALGSHLADLHVDEESTPEPPSGPAILGMLKRNPSRKSTIVHVDESKRNPPSAAGQQPWFKRSPPPSAAIGRRPNDRDTLAVLQFSDEES